MRDSLPTSDNQRLLRAYVKTLGESQPAYIVKLASLAECVALQGDGRATSETLRLLKEYEADTELMTVFHFLEWLQRLG